MKTKTPNQQLVAFANKRKTELAAGRHDMAAALRLITRLTNALNRADREIQVPSPVTLEVQGNRGGSYVKLTDERQVGMVHLEIGETCVRTVNESISVAALAMILTAAKDKGFQQVVNDYVGQGGGSPAVNIDRDIDTPLKKERLI